MYRFNGIIRPVPGPNATAQELREWHFENELHYRRQRKIDRIGLGFTVLLALVGVCAWGYFL